MARSSLIPGFRFHPTDVELVMFYLKRKLLGKKLPINAVAEVNIYDFSPWDLPDKSALKSGDLEWYFFSPKAKKYSSGGRSNRTTETGFWKATGKDRMVKYNDRTVATIKTLVFHLGNKGKGERTDWVMHEYKMEDEYLANVGVVQDMYVLCKVYMKSGSGPKNGAQYGAPFIEEAWGDDLDGCVGSEVMAGPVGASNTMANEQEGMATTNLTELSSSTVTFSANLHTNAQSSAVTQDVSVDVPGSASGTLDVTDTQFHLSGVDDFMAGPVGASNTMANEQEGTATTNLTELSSSTVTFSANLHTNAQSSAVTQDVSVDVPGSASGTLDVTDTQFHLSGVDDFMFIEDINQIMGSEDEAATNVENGKSAVTDQIQDDIYTGLVNLINLDDLNETDFKTDGADYTFDKLLPLDDLDEFYVE